MKMKFNRILFFLIITLYCVVVPASSSDDYNEEYGALTDYFSSFTHLPFTNSPITRYYRLDVKTVMASPDGYEREVWTANGIHPGPILRANKGDRIVVEIVNGLDQVTGIHWHGMFQLGTNWYDGAPGFTQCSIPNGETFVYDFYTYQQSGTYWWHSHILSQYIDGLRGALIIHDQDDPYLNDYDEEYVITMSDWYHQTAPVLVPQRTKPGYQGLNPVPDSGLISGLGRYNCSAAPEGSKCKSDAPLANYQFEKGKKYRLRLINMSAEALFTFSIDSHKMTIIEADGEYIKPSTVEKLPINVAQRYSVIVEADQDIKNYWIRATIQDACLGKNNQTINFDSAIDYKVVGILNYKGVNNNYPTTTESSEQPEACKDLPSKDLIPLYMEPIYEPYKKFVLNVTFFTDAQGAPVSGFNQVAFVPDYNYPTLEKVLDGVDPNSLPDNQAPLVYDSNGFVDVVILNPLNAAHPFHMHGHTFYILGSGNGTKVVESELNTVNPTRRDVVTSPGLSWTVIRFKPDNPGVWAFHCHIEWHMVLGLAAQLIEYPTQLRQRQLPAASRALCDMK